jgi:hypothetical protein
LVSAICLHNGVIGETGEGVGEEKVWGGRFARTPSHNPMRFRTLEKFSLHSTLRRDTSVKLTSEFSLHEMLVGTLQSIWFLSNTVFSNAK